MSLVTDAVVLARKDLLVEMRAKRAVASAVALAGIALVIVGLGVGPDATRLRSLAPALVWVALLYAAIAVAERMEHIDRSDEAFLGLWLVLADRRAIYLGRVLSLTAFLGLLQLAIWAAATVLLDVPLGAESLALVPLSALTALAAASIVGLASAMVAHADHRPLLLPVILLPLLVPTFLAGTGASAAILEARPTDAAGWVLGLVLGTALFAGLGLLTYEAAASPD